MRGGGKRYLTCGQIMTLLIKLGVETCEAKEMLGSLSLISRTCMAVSL